MKTPMIEKALFSFCARSVWNARRIASKKGMATNSRGKWEEGRGTGRDPSPFPLPPSPLLEECRNLRRDRVDPEPRHDRRDDGAGGRQGRGMPVAVQQRGP